MYYTSASDINSNVSDTVISVEEKISRLELVKTDTSSVIYLIIGTS